MAWSGSKDAKGKQQKDKRPTCPGGFGVCPPKQPWCSSLEPMVNSAICEGKFMTGERSSAKWAHGKRGQLIVFTSLLSRDWILRISSMFSSDTTLKCASTWYPCLGCCFFPLLTALRTPVRISSSTSGSSCCLPLLFISSLLLFLNVYCLKNCSTALHPK